jgi:hypothetical protein
MPRRFVKTKKRATLTTIVILLLIYTAMSLFNKFINAIYVTQNGFQMGSYHPWTFWISLVAGIIWMAAARLRKLGLWWYIPGILGIIYAVYMLAGGIIYGGWLI